MFRHRIILPGLAALAYAIAFAQRPGQVVADTAVDLYADPARLVSRLISAWSQTVDLGHVWRAGSGGLLFPMASWFALGHAVGLATWIVQRLWLGTVLFLAAWGVVRMMEALWQRDRGVPHTAAAALYVANPYVAVAVNRSSIVLVAYAALPWLLLAANRGLRDPAGWRWPAAFALVLTATGGGAGAPGIGWVLGAALALVVYDLRWGGVARRALVPYGWRLALALAAASAWWLVAAVVRARYGTDALALGDQPRSIMTPGSLGEALRLAGGLRPAAGSQPALFDSRVVVVAGLLVPALALTGFRWTRRARYGPLFLALALAGAVAAAASRSAYAAEPLVALGVAVLGGGALAAAQARIPWIRYRVVLAAAAAALLAAAAWPLVTGRAMERRLQFTLPGTWRSLARDLDRRGDASRALLEPAQRLAFHRWGGTLENPLPALTAHAVLATSYDAPSDARAAGLQRAVDELIVSGRALPGQLRPLLNLMAVGDLVITADGRGDALTATDALEPLFDTPGTRYGATRLASPPSGMIAPAQRLPEIRRVELGTSGIVRVLPRGPAVIVDGGPGGLVAMAAFDDLPSDRPIRYAQDLPPAQLRAAAEQGATVVAARPDAAVGDALRGAALSRAPLEWLLARDPATAQLTDTVALPDARRWSAQAWVRADPRAPDPLLDRLAGTSGPGSASSSSRYQARPAFRGSSAFDGDPATAWAGTWDGRGAFLSWSTLRQATVRTLRALAPRFVARAPTLVALNGRRAAVAADGTISFNPPVRGRRFRLDILRAAFPGGTPPRLRRARAAIAIAELRGAGLRLTVPRSGPLRAPCGSAALRAATTTLGLRVSGDVADLDAGRPLRAFGCGAVALPAAPTPLRGLPRALVIENLRLAARAPGGIVVPGAGGSVLRQGIGGRGRRDGVRVSISGPSWLVLGTGYNRGWRAHCNGHDLGPPTPIEGYANGWLAKPGCSAVDFRFAPDDTLRLGYLVSIFGIPFLILAVMRRRRPGYTSLEPLPAPEGDRLTGALTGAAGALLVAGVPAGYLLGSWDEAHRLGHWIAVASIALLGLELIRTLVRARAPGRAGRAS